MDAQQLFQDQQHAEFPVCTQVTLNHGICDSRCISCPVGRLRYGDASPEVEAELAAIPRVEMPFELFTRVADEVAVHSHAWLRMHARGEPLLHPRFVNMVDYAKRAGVGVVQAFTDAVALNESRARAILESGLDVLECSIHGHEKTYEQLMRNGQFERVKRNVIRFRKLRDETGARTRLVVSAVDQPLFQTEKAQHRQFWSDYADQVIYRPYHSWGDRIDIACAPVSHPRQACAQLWTRCTIGPTGKILACFNSWAEHEDEVLGDLTQEGVTIAKVWKSQLAVRYRQDHVNGAYTLPCCERCTDWRGSSWGKNSYEHLIDSKLGLKHGDAT